MEPTALDHVALWVADRDPLADFLCDHAGMHVVDRTDAFTLVGSDARRGKLTLFAAEGPRDPGALERVVLRVSDLERRARRPAERAGGRTSAAASPPSRRPRASAWVWSRRPAPTSSTTSTTWCCASPTPRARGEGLAALGLRPEADDRLHGRRQARAPRAPDATAETDRPLLNHIALLVDSGQEHLDEARDRGIEIAEVRDAANTFAFFVWGPDGIQLEYVEHKPEFSLT